MIVHFLPWQVTIKPRFRRICFTFSKHLMQVEVGEDLWRDLLIFHHRWTPLFLQANAKTLTEAAAVFHGGGRLVVVFGPWNSQWKLQRISMIMISISKLHFEVVLFFKDLCIFYPLPGSTLRQFGFHICFKCLVQPTPPKKCMFTPHHRCLPVLRRFKVNGVCFVNGKSCLDTWRPQLPDICCVRSTFE